MKMGGTTVCGDPGSSSVFGQDLVDELGGLGLVVGLEDLSQSSPQPMDGDEVAGLRRLGHSVPEVFVVGQKCLELLGGSDPVTVLLRRAARKRTSTSA